MCQIPYGPSPGHEIYSEMLQGAPNDNGDILVPLNYPYHRTDTRTYTNSGRLWVPSTAQEKILSQLYPGRGPTSVGAGLGQGNDAFFVRPSSEPWPDVLLSPYQVINQDTIAEAIRRQPWLQRSPSRTDAMITELRQAQNELLRQQGLIAHVRSHVNPHALTKGAAEPKQSGDVKPSGVIRVRPANPAPNPNTLRTSLPADDQITRISLPDDTTAPEPRITVVRQETEPETASADQG
jgi:hypothetical protein